MTLAPEVVLVHGAGDTAAVWSDVQTALANASVVLDLLGRGRHPFDLAAVTLDLAVEQAAVDIDEATAGPVVLVAHSIGGALSPGIVRLLGTRVVHLVHVAAVAAPDGDLPFAVASEEFARGLLTDADRVRGTLRGATYAEPGATLPPGLRPTHDQLGVTRLDSLNFGCVPTSWAGVSAQLRRTFVPPLRDRLYPPDAQECLAATLCADDIVTVYRGHNVARSAPARLAVVFHGIAMMNASKRETV